jgi:hypothetical protein
LRRGHFFEARVHFGGGAGMHAATLTTTSNPGSVVSSGADTFYCAQTDKS